MHPTLYHFTSKDTEALSSLDIDDQIRIKAILDVFSAVDAAPHKTRMETWSLAVAAGNESLELQGIPGRLKVHTLACQKAAFKQSGNDWTVLIDLRKYHNWSKIERRMVGEVPPATVQWWKQLIEQFKGRALCQRQAHKRAIAIWSLGQPIPGYDTPPPAGKDGIPDSWGYTNFCRLSKRNEYEKVRGRQGAKAAANLAFHVPTSRTEIVVGQFYMLDDVWQDFKVKRTIKSEPMRLLELCALDLRSGMKVCYGLKPEVMNDETGVRQRLQERDMRFFLAALMTLRGYRRAGTTLIGERGTAVVREDIQRILSDATDGAITFEASSMRDTPMYPGWFRGRKGGNPRYKAALESSFNPQHNALAMLAGQVGSNERINGPEELYGRERADEALVKMLGGLSLSADLCEALRPPFMLLSQASRIIDAIYDWFNDRKDHDLEGFEAAGLVTGELRLDPRTNDWTPLYALRAKNPEQEHALSALMNLPGCYRMRKMSPAEVWERDAGGLVRLPLHVLPGLIGRELGRERKVNDHGSFLFDDTAISPEALRYVGIAVNPRGHEVMLREGETYLTFCNPFDPRYLLVCDAQGGYIGRCLRVERAGRADDEALAMAMGQAAHVNALRARAFLARNAWQAEKRVEEEDQNVALLAAASKNESTSESQARRCDRSKFRPSELLDGNEGELVPAGGFESPRFDAESLL